MVRAIWICIGLFLLLNALLALGFLPAPIAFAVAWFVGTVWSFSCPLMFLMFFWAPGFFRETSDGISRFFARIGARRREEDALHQKIAHLDKAHHMTQLGGVLYRQGRFRKAAEWFQRAIEKESDSIEAHYRLGLCQYELKDYKSALEHLKLVYDQKPQYDYGLVDLRLAQTYQKLGALQEAAEVYETMLKFYPGQPEGCFGFAKLKAERGDLEGARKLMSEVIFSVRHSPVFQRRRNRHWSLRAKWWLVRNGRGA